MSESYECGPGNHRNCQHAGDALRERAFNEWRDNDQYSTLVAPKEYRAFRAGVEFGAAEARKNGVPWEKTAAARAVADAARRPLIEALRKYGNHLPGCIFALDASCSCGLAALRSAEGEGDV